MSDIEDGGRTKPSSSSPPPPPQLSSSPSPSRLAKILVSSLACRQFLAFVSFVPALSDFMGLSGHSWSSPARYFAQRAPKSCAGSVFSFPQADRAVVGCLLTLAGKFCNVRYFRQPLLTCLTNVFSFDCCGRAYTYISVPTQWSFFSSSPVSLCIICKFLECTVRMRDWWLGLLRKSVRDPGKFSPIAISHLLK